MKEHQLKFALVFLLLFSANLVKSQTVRGVVKEKASDGHEHTLPGANIYWIGTTTGVSSDANGKFEISSKNISDKRLIVSFTGFSSDTINASEKTNISVFLKSAITLKEVHIDYDLDEMRSSGPVKMETFHSDELKKAACCNLGESFETNATVDITLKDAVSGSKEIQVLGLSGAFTQLLTENAPVIYGIGLTYGLNGIPGTQIDAINIVKEPGSVIFGHESISGMVNVDLKDPMHTDKFFLNAFMDDNARKELNIEGSKVFNPHLASLYAFHADNFSKKVDMNKDGFTDMPLLSNVSFLNKWKYIKNGLISQNTLKFLGEQRMGGQTTFDFQKDSADSSAYGQKLNTKRAEFYGRTGYVIPTETYNSIGLQYSVVLHDQQGFYGMKYYLGNQEMFDLKIIHDIAYNRTNTLNTGFSFKHVYSHEQFDMLHLVKHENIPGAFMENTFQHGKIISLITSIRADYFDNKVFLTPRANFKYSLGPKTDIRFSVGTGWKTVDLLAENPGILASSRTIHITEKLLPEQALNTGFNLSHKFTLNYRKGNIGFDLYRTIFTNKIIPDYESDSTSTKVVFSNLSGKSYSDNFQFEAEYEVLKKLKVKAAYKFLNVYAIKDGIKKQEVLIPEHRIFANAFYESFNKHWNFSSTLQWYGPKRLPNTSNNPIDFRMPVKSPSYSVLSGQITRVFSFTELYIGCENVFDFRQSYSIINSQNPYGMYFDTVSIWGPLEGRKFYAGVRFKIK